MMQSLGLELSPEQYHLQKNAAPFLTTLSALFVDGQQLVQQFRGTNDTRDGLKQLGERITAALYEFSLVTNQDLAQIEAEAEKEQRFRFLAAINRKIVGAVPHLYSEEEGTKPRRKQIVSRLHRISTLISSREDGRAARETAASDAEMVRNLIREILDIDDRVDPWQPRMMISSCDIMAKALREMPRKAEPARPESLGLPNAARAAVIDLVHTAEGAIGALGISQHGGRERVEPLSAKIKALREALLADLWAPVDVASVRAKILEMQDDLTSLATIPSQLGAEVTFHFFAAESKYALLCLGDVVKVVGQKPLGTLMGGGN